MKQICKECGEIKEHYAKGMCYGCYNKKQGKKYYIRNKEKLKAYSRKYSQENKDKLRENRKRYYLENREKCKRESREYRLKNPEKRKAINRKYKFENSERLKVANREYRHKNPGKWREWNLKRRSYGTVKRGVVERVITENILKYGILTCENTTGPLGIHHCEDNFHLDHVVPASKGGSNGYDNLQILCEHCNVTKHVKITDYRQDIKNNQMFLKITEER